MRERSDHGYDEEAFRYFLALEQKRANRANQSCVLLLVDLKRHAETAVPMDPQIADKMFASLFRCLRETDFFGWYQDGRVAGAVLTQHESGPGAEFPRVVGDRVNQALCKSLPSEVARRVQIRLYRLPPDLEPELAIG
jgi:hypothetical protein